MFNGRKAHTANTMVKSTVFEDEWGVRKTPCSECKELKYYSEYYPKSGCQHIPKEHLQKNHLRSDCIDCYLDKDMNNKAGYGWISPKKLQDRLNSANLNLFIEETENA